MQMFCMNEVGSRSVWQDVEPIFFSVRFVFGFMRNGLAPQGKIKQFELPKLSMSEFP